MGKTLQDEQQELNAAFRDLGRQLARPLESLLLIFSRFLERHPEPRWLSIVLSPVDWLGNRVGRFIRWLFR